MISEAEENFIDVGYWAPPIMYSWLFGSPTPPEFNLDSDMGGLA